MDDTAYSADSGVFAAAGSPHPPLPVPFDWYGKGRGELEDKLAGLSFSLKPNRASAPSRAPPPIHLEARAMSPQPMHQIMQSEHEDRMTYGQA